jgi:uncharacterized protein DUF6815
MFYNVVQLRTALVVTPGNGGEGVWKVELVSEAAGKASVVRVLQARRGSVLEQIPLREFMRRCEIYLASNGCIVDQPFQSRLPDGMIRCYMSADKAVGFGHQFIKALIPPPPEGPDSPAAQPGPRIMHGADAEPFQLLRAKMEAEWTPQMMEVLGIDATSLPVIWDASAAQDFAVAFKRAQPHTLQSRCRVNAKQHVGRDRADREHQGHNGNEANPILPGSEERRDTFHHR